MGFLVFVCLFVRKENTVARNVSGRGRGFGKSGFGIPEYEQRIMKQLGKQDVATFAIVTCY